MIILVAAGDATSLHVSVSEIINKLGWEVRIGQVRIGLPSLDRVGVEVCHSLANCLFYADFIGPAP